MNSARPTALHLLMGKPLITYALEAVEDISSYRPSVLIGGNIGDFEELLGERVRYVVQDHPLKIGQALLKAEGVVRGENALVVITPADMPLISPETITGIIEAQSSNSGPATILALKQGDQNGSRRFLKDSDGSIAATEDVSSLDLENLNAGIYCFDSKWLWEQLASKILSTEGEQQLAELVRMAARDGLSVMTVPPADACESLRIKNRAKLAQAGEVLRSKINMEWMLAGVTMIDPQKTYIDREAKIGPDTVIYPDTYIQGESRIGPGCRIGPNSIIYRSKIGERCVVLASVVEDAIIEDNVDIGPFSHMRKGAHLASGVHIGNFGEVKNSYLGHDTKMGHFSYIGDGTIGTNVNIGAGTITCNFDGEKKNPTEIEDDVFVGSDTMLVAPVKLEKGSRTGAGSVVTKDVPKNTIVAGVPARAIRKIKKDD